MSLFLAATESSLVPEFHVPGVQLWGQRKEKGARKNIVGVGVEREGGERRGEETRPPLSPSSLLPPFPLRLVKLRYEKLFPFFAMALKHS